jgi:two-component system, chemotaxis family, protein-glutamate methylesterase/glutaminase
MNILLAHPLPVQSTRFAKRLSDGLGLNVTFVASDLTETFNAAEHMVPDAVLIAEALALRHEFEVLKALFDALRIPCLILEDSQPLLRRTRPQELAALPRVSVGASEAVLRDALKSAALGKRSAQPCQTQRRVQGTGSFDSRKTILIGSSTGGVDALIKVLRTFPENCPPTLIVQHTGDGFSDSLIRVLNRESEARVVEAVHGQPIAPGHVYLATGKRHHLKLGAGTAPRVLLEESSAVCGHRPSVDVLFRSALTAPKLVVAALLTGMGRDGAEGITALRRAGSITIGQDQATSVVYGMPRVAHELGGIAAQLPIDRIGQELLKSCRVGSS